MVLGLQELIGSLPGEVLIMRAHARGAYTLMEAPGDAPAFNTSYTYERLYLCACIMFTYIHA